jgi:hypothetical protein
VTPLPISPALVRSEIGTRLMERAHSARRKNIMGTSFNIQVTGFVGGEPQVKEVGEQRVASFSVAVSRKNGGGKKVTLWVRVNCWNRLADVATEYIRKG